MTSMTFELNEDIQKNATTVLATMGLSLNDAVQLFLLKIATEKVLPFSPINMVADPKNLAESPALAMHRIGAMPNIKVPDDFDDIMITDFDE